MLILIFGVSAKIKTKNSKLCVLCVSVLIKKIQNNVPNGYGPAQLIALALVQLTSQGAFGPVPLASFPLKRFILSVIH